MAERLFLGGELNLAVKIVISETVSHTGLVYMCLHTDAEQSVFYNLRFKHIYPVAGALLYYVNIAPVVSLAVDSWIADNSSLQTRSSKKKKKKKAKSYSI